MGRYSMRLRNIWGDDEPTWGESAQHGMEAGLDYMTKKAEADREFGNEVSKQGGTIAKQRGIADRLRDWKGTLPGHGDYNSGGEFDQASAPPMASTERAPAPGSVASRSNSYDGPTGDFVGEDYDVGGGPRGSLPNSMLPTPTGFNPRAGALPQMQQPSRGIAGAINASQQPQQQQPQQQQDDTYEVRGPNGERARIPRTDPATRSKRAYDDAERSSLASDIEAARNGDQSALARVQARNPSLLTDVEPFSARGSGNGMTFEQRDQLEEAKHQQRLREIDERGKYSNYGVDVRSGDSRYGADTRSGDSRYGADTRSGDSRYGADTRAGSSQYSADHRTGGGGAGAGGKGQTQAQRISALRAQLTVADRLAPADPQQRRRLERTPDGQRRVREGDRLRERVNGQLEAAINGEEYVEQTQQVGIGANRNTAVARAKFLAGEARKKWPNASPEQIRRAVKSGMAAEGFTGSEP